MTAQSLVLHLVAPQIGYQFHQSHQMSCTALRVCYDGLASHLCANTPLLLCLHSISIPISPKCSFYFLIYLSTRVFFCLPVSPSVLSFSLHIPLSQVPIAFFQCIYVYCYTLSVPLFLHLCTLLLDHFTFALLLSLYALRTFAIHATELLTYIYSGSRAAHMYTPSAAQCSLNVTTGFI
jgi:hypothetical protein